MVEKVEVEVEKGSCDFHCVYSRANVIDYTKIGGNK